MIELEYRRFLQTLIGTTSNDLRKVANLVLQHLDDLLPLTTAQGQRVKKIVTLAQKKWDVISDVIEPLPAQASIISNQIRELASLEVGPFRGFAKSEFFDLASSTILVYGQNGTGKSSFCEALEYGLIGSVAEGESKRFREKSEYLKNAHTNTFAPPVIKARDIFGKEVVLAADESTYRFCFVERNRIDSFSRIAAQSPARQTELISTLFGLESFSDFVRNFSLEIDEKYIDLKGIKSNELNLKRQELSGYEHKLQDAVNAIEKINLEEADLAEKFRQGITFQVLQTELYGDDQSLGLIRTLEQQLQQPLQRISDLTVAKLKTAQLNLTESLSQSNEIRMRLAELSQQVSFKHLYEAVNQVQASSLFQCPACKTSLTKTTLNPYINATDELKKLEHLSVFEHELSKQEKAIGQVLDFIFRVLKKCVSYNPQNNVLTQYATTDDISVDLSWWNSMQQKLPNGFTPWENLELQVNALEQNDITTHQFGLKNADRQQQLAQLRAFDKAVIQLQARRAEAEGQKRALQLVISEFNLANSQLIADASAEIILVERNKAIADAYQNFVAKLNIYKNSLPEKLVADLGGRVVELYNAFNRFDQPSEKLEIVRLPLLQSQRLQISFKNAPEKFFDALHVLSEGHIRCIGLSILLAKNIKEECPFLIFDDPVNAIDDDHRECIRLTLYQDDFFKGKQIILTCHGEEFLKDIQNLFSVAKSRLAKEYTFLPRIDEPHIRFHTNITSRNYIVSAKAHLDNGEKRVALAKARQALESLANNKIWKYVSKYGDGNLTLKLRSAKSPIELRNLIEQLKSKIEKVDFSDPNKIKVLKPLDDLLGLWIYLNKGTHDETDRPEFNMNSVSQILKCLEELDESLA